MTVRSVRRSTVTVAILFLLNAVAVPAPAASIAATNDCDDQIAAASLLNSSGDYAGALAAFDAIVEECDGKSERIAIQTNRAHALNQLGRYTEAYTAANAALQDDDKHLFALSERAYANERLGNTDLAIADYNRIIELTEKNQNVAERATNYAKVADLYYKQGNTAEAQANMAKAIELDPTNPDFAIIQGDWAASSGDYDAAQASYQGHVRGRGLPDQGRDIGEAGPGEVRYDQCPGTARADESGRNRKGLFGCQEGARPGVDEPADGHVLRARLQVSKLDRIELQIDAVKQKFIR
jgi:tetratricopeptide (TPR) repeat protein